MRVKSGEIYRVYKFVNDKAPYSFFIWDMADFQPQNVLLNVAKIFPDPPILQSAITGRLEGEDEFMYEFESLDEINDFEGDLNIYKLHLDLGEVQLIIEDEDRLIVKFNDLAISDKIMAFLTKILEIPDIDMYLDCFYKPNIYHCFDFYGKFIEHRENIGEL